MNVDPSQPIGLIGLGLLGTAISERLRQASFIVVGFDIDRQKRKDFSQAGGLATDTITRVTRECEHVILSLPDSSVSASVLKVLEPNLRGVECIIDTTTGDPHEMTQIGLQLAKQGIGYLDATVAGSSEQARRGQALIMVGGDDAHVAACQDILDALGRKTMHVGPSGSGARMKLVVNLVLGLNRAVLAEGLSFAKATGVDPVKALEVLKASPAYSTVMDTKGDKMLTGDFTPQARLRQHLKDVRLILESAAASGATTPLSEWHADTLQALVDQGHGDDDNSSIIRAFE